MKKIIAILLVLVMCLPCVAACKKDESMEEETTVSVPVSIISGGASDYVLVYTIGEGDMKNVSYTICKLIQDTVASVTGVTMEIVNDATAPKGKEIIVGTGARKDSYTSPVAAETYLNGYSVFLSGEKLVLEAGSRTGMYFGAYALLRDLLGVDLRDNPELAKDESRTEFTLLSTYVASEPMTSAELPYMGIPLSEFGVCYNSTNYIQMRAAITLQQEVKKLDGVIMEKVTHSWAKEDKAYFYFDEDKTLEDGGFRIQTTGNRIHLYAKDYYGYVSAIRSIMKQRKSLGYYPFRDGTPENGGYLDYLLSYEETSRYAFEHTSEYRLMFYNVLWDETEVVERAKLQTSMIGVYQPDVVGFQEFKVNRRSSFVSAMQKLGYAESMEYTKGNMVSASYGTGTDPKLYSYVPIFYKTATTKCIESGFYRYTAQISEWESASKTLSWGIYESKSSGERYMVVNTHMCTQDNGIRGRQAAEAVTVINEVLTRYNVPVFLGGDYNGRYGDANFLYFANQGGFTDIEKNNLATEYTSKLRSYHRPYPIYDASIGLMQPDAGDDTGVYDATQSVDHIMMKNASSVSVSVYGVIADECTMSGGDHYPIFTDFSINS